MDYFDYVNVRCKERIFEEIKTHLKVTKRQNSCKFITSKKFIRTQKEELINHNWSTIDIDHEIQYFSKKHFSVQR